MDFDDNLRIRRAHGEKCYPEDAFALCLLNNLTKHLECRQVRRSILAVGM